MTGKNQFILILLISLLTSCIGDNNIQPEQDGDKSMMTVMVDTKAQGPSAIVNHVQMMIFDEAGSLEQNVMSSNLVLNVSVRTGKKRIAIVANAERLNCTNFNSLLNYRFNLEDNNTVDDNEFQMVGYAESDIIVSKDPISIKVSLERVVSKIHVNTIQNLMPSTIGPIKLTMIYLSNVPAQTPVLMPKEEQWSCDRWMNIAGRVKDSDRIISDPSEVQMQTLTCRPIMKDLHSGETISILQNMYTFPNLMGTDVIAPNKPGKTRLVIETIIQDKKYWYPITIEVPERNILTTYSIKINNVGSDDPAIPVMSNAITTNWKVAPWDKGPDYIENI